MANEPVVSFARRSSLPDQVLVGRFITLDTGTGSVEEYVGTESGWKKIVDKDVYTKAAANDRFGQLDGNNEWSHENHFYGRFYIGDSSTNFEVDSENEIVDVGSVYGSVNLNGSVLVPSGSAISWANAPTTDNHLTNKRYVDANTTKLWIHEFYKNDFGTILMLYPTAEQVGYPGALTADHKPGIVFSGTDLDEKIILAVTGSKVVTYDCENEMIECISYENFIFTETIYEY